MDAAVGATAGGLSPAPGFDALAALLAELNDGETAALVSFESALLLDSTKVFPLRSIFERRVLSTDPLKERPAHVTVVPASLVVNEKPSRQSPSRTMSPNSSFSSDGGGESSRQFTMHVLCENLELRSAQKEPAVVAGDDTADLTEEKSHIPSDFRVLMGKPDGKATALKLPSPAKADSLANSAPPPSAKLFLRGLLRSIHVNPSWFSGDSMILNPAADLSADQRTRGLPGTMSPRKAHARAKNLVAAFVAFQSLLVVEETCAVVDIVPDQQSPNQVEGSATALMFPLTASTCILMPIHEAIHSVLALLSHGAGAAARRLQQEAAPSSQGRRIPTRRTISAGIVSDTPNSSHTRLSSRAVYPPSFYFSTRSRQISFDETQKQCEQPLAHLEHGFHFSKLDTNLLRRHNLVPVNLKAEPHSIPLAHLSEAYLSILQQNPPDERLRSPSRRSPRKHRRPSQQQEVADEGVSYSDDGQESEAEADTQPVMDARKFCALLVSQGASLSSVEAELVNFLSGATAEVNPYALDLTPEMIKTEFRNKLIGRLMPNHIDRTPAEHTRECRIQIALRLECSSSLRADSEANDGEFSHSNRRPSALLARVELSKQNREEVLRLLQSIRILLDAESEGGFVEYFCECVVAVWLSKCPFALRWLWNGLELQSSRMPDTLRQRSKLIKTTEEPAKPRQRRRPLPAIIDDLDDVDVSSSARRAAPKRKRDLMEEDVFPPENSPVPDLDFLPSSQVSQASQASSSAGRGSPSAKRRKVAATSQTVPAPADVEMADDPSNARIARATRSANLLSRLRSASNANAPEPSRASPAPVTVQDRHQRDDDDGEYSDDSDFSKASTATSTASRGAKTFSFSPEDIMNKVKGLSKSNSNSNLSKRETSVRYYAKRPRSPPPKSPPRLTRSQVSPHK